MSYIRMATYTSNPRCQCFLPSSLLLRHRQWLHTPQQSFVRFQYSRSHKTRSNTRFKTFQQSLTHNPPSHAKNLTGPDTASAWHSNTVSLTANEPGFIVIEHFPNRITQPEWKNMDKVLGHLMLLLLLNLLHFCLWQSKGENCKAHTMKFFFVWNSLVIIVEALQAVN